MSVGNMNHPQKALSVPKNGSNFKSRNTLQTFQ